MAEAAAAAEAEAASEGAAADASQEDAKRNAAGDAPAGSAANGTAEPPDGVPTAAAGAPDLAGASAGHGSDSDVVCVDEDEGDTAHSGYSGFYRASRETGRANILLALQVGRPRSLTVPSSCCRQTP